MMPYFLNGGSIVLEIVAPIWVRAVVDVLMLTCVLLYCCWVIRNSIVPRLIYMRGREKKRGKLSRLF